MIFFKISSDSAYSLSRIVRKTVNTIPAAKASAARSSSSAKRPGSIAGAMRQLPRPERISTMPLVLSEAEGSMRTD